MFIDFRRLRVSNGAQTAAIVPQSKVRANMDYRVTFRVSQANLGLIFDLLKGERNISLENVIPLTNETPSANRQHTFAGGKRLKGITGEALILEMTAGGKTVTREQIQQAFVDRQFADSSHTAAIAKAINARLIARNGDGRYYAVNPTVRK